jgi:hypothetical protein
MVPGNGGRDKPGPIPTSGFLCDSKFKNKVEIKGVKLGNNYFCIILFFSP